MTYPLFTRYQCLLLLPSCLQLGGLRRREVRLLLSHLSPQDVGASDELTLRQAKLGEGGGWCSSGRLRLCRCALHCAEKVSTEGRVLWQPRSMGTYLGCRVGGGRVEVVPHWMGAKKN